MEKNKIEELLEKINDSITKGKALINDLENQKSMLNAMLEENEVKKEDTQEEVKEEVQEIVDKLPEAVEEKSEVVEENAEVSEDNSEVVEESSEVVEEKSEVVEDNATEVVEETKEEKSLLNQLQDSTVKFSSVQRMLNINKMKATIIKNKFKNSFNEKDEEKVEEQVEENVDETTPEKDNNLVKEVMDKLVVGAKITGARAVGVPRNKITSLRSTIIEKLSDNSIDVKTEENDPNSLSTMLDSILDTKQAKTI